MTHRILSISVHDVGARIGSGLKRQKFDVVLGGVDLLVGPNGAGKTTRGPLAITAALEGLATVPTDARRPYVGGLPEATGVTVVTTAGTLTRDLSVAKGKAVDAANQRARDLIGIPPTAWDLRDFASGTDGDRGKILDAVARAGGALERWDAERAKEHVREIVTRGVETDNVDAWTAPWSECCAALPAAVDAPAWLGEALGWAEKKQTETNAAQRAANDHLGEITRNPPPVPEGDDDADAAAVREIQKREAALSSSAEDVARAEAALARHQAEGARLKEALDAVAKEGARLKEPTPAPDLTIPAEVTQRVAAARAALDAPIEAYDGPTADSFAEAIATAEAELSEARTAKLEAERLLNEASEKVATVRAALGEAGEEIERLERKLAAADAEAATLRGMVDHDATCRHCKGADPLGVGVRLDEANARVEGVRAKLTKARHGDEARANALSLALDGERFAKTTLIKLDERVQAAERALSDAKTRQSAAANVSASHEKRVREARERELKNARDESTREERRANERRQAWEEAETRRVHAYNDAKRRWYAANDALKKWQATAPPTIPAPPSEEELAAIRAELAEVEARRAARVRHDDHIARVTRAREAYESAKLTWDATRALVGAIRQARDDVAAAAYSPIDRAARELLEGADVAGLPLPYFASPSDYGAIVPGRGRVPYAGLSESEQRITAAALVYALATVAGCPCRLVLLDGLEVVQGNHRVALVSALTRAQQSGKVDSVVLTMATEPDEDLQAYRAIEGLTVHEVERTATEAEPEAAEENPWPEHAPVFPAAPVEDRADPDCPF